MSTLRLYVYDPHVWAVVLALLAVLIVCARCDDFSTYPKG